MRAGTTGGRLAPSGTGCSTVGAMGWLPVRGAPLGTSTVSSRSAELRIRRTSRSNCGSSTPSEGASSAPVASSTRLCGGRSESISARISSPLMEEREGGMLWLIRSSTSRPACSAAASASRWAGASASSSSISQ
jgi:hypothetical protein